MAYRAANAVHLTDSAYRDDDGYWYGIRRSVLGFIVDSSMLRRMEIDAPADWADLLELPYQELIWTSNYAADGAGRLLLRAAMQQPEAFGGRDYLVSLDENMALYTASDAEMVRCLGTGECVIGIGFLHDGMASALPDDNCTGLRLICPPPAARPRRWMPPPSSRTPLTPVPPSCGRSTRCRRSAWIWPPRTAATSTPSSTMPHPSLCPPSLVWAAPAPATGG